MQLKTILNHVQKFKSFIYKKARWNNDVLEVLVAARTNSHALCSGCGQPAPGYDRLKSRRFEFVPLWGIRVFLVYAPRRVQCSTCGVRVERMPWAKGKHRITDTYAWFLAQWARRLSWKETARIFHSSWDTVFRSVKMAVDWGLANRSLEGIASIGVDEIAWKKGHSYLTLVYQIDQSCKRLLWIGEKRTVKTLLKFFHMLGSMWKPYLKVIAKKAPNALHILDRFHIMAYFSKALDAVRAEETRALKEKGLEPVLTKSRWLLLKRPENLTDKQDVRFADLLQYNIKSVRAYLLKEDFQAFWTYRSTHWAGVFLDLWCKKTMRSKIDPLKKIAAMLRRHRPLLLNWFRAGGLMSSGVVEGFNGKAKLIARKSYGFRSFNVMQTALYHTMGGLPEPNFTHKFC